MEEKIRAEGFDFISLRHLSRKGMNPLEDMRLIMELYGIYKREAPDFALQYTIKPNIYGSIAAKFALVRAISTVTGLGFTFAKKNFVRAVTKRLYRFAFGFNEKVFFQNEDDRFIFDKERIVGMERSLYVQGSGVDTSAFSPEFCKNIVPEGTSFILIARMLWDKGIGEFVEAAEMVKKKHPETVFRLLGPLDQGNPSMISKDIIEQWEGRALISYMGATSEVRPFICASDVVVLPSYREGAPRSLLEAMAMGRAIITTDVPGCRDVVDEGLNGFLVAPRDARALARAMEKMIELGEQARTDMGLAGRAKVQREFDETIVVAKYIKTLEQALSAR
jgi:glycosyltransferase involved in cell wall biosynthesis